MDWRPVLWPLASEPATCVWGKRSPHTDAPRRDCSCGYYAFFTLKQLEQDINFVYHGRQPRYKVLGAVVGWGRILLCEDGWRSEYARPLALLAQDIDRGEEFDRATLGVAERYDIPILPRDEIEAYALWFGRPAGEIVGDETGERL
jgi:hypothetical protein